MRDQPSFFEHIPLKNRIRFLVVENIPTFPPGIFFGAKGQELPRVPSFSCLSGMLLFLFACILNFTMKPQIWIKNPSSVRWNRHHFEYLKQRFHKLKQLGWMQTSDTNLWKRLTFFKTLLLWKYLSRKNILEFFYSWVFVSVFFFWTQTRIHPPRTQKIQAQVRLPHSRRDNHKTLKKKGFENCLALETFRNLMVAPLRTDRYLQSPFIAAPAS